MSDMDKEPWEYNDRPQNGRETAPGEQPQDAAPAQDPAADGQEPVAPGPDSPAAPEETQGGDAGRDNPAAPNGGASPYGNQQPPYGGWNGGQSGAPYPPYGAPQGQYPPYGGQYGGQGYNRYDNPYSPQGGGQPPYWNPYGQGQPPHRMNGGLKVFLWFLGVVTVGLVASFLFFSAHPDLMQEGAASSASSRYAEGSSSSASSGGFNGTLPKDPASSSASSGSVIGGVSGNGTDSSFQGITVAKKPAGEAMSAKDVYKKLIQSVVGVETTISASETGESETGEGTGIVATSDGYILTNAHVVNYSRNNKVKVVMHNNQEYSAKVVGYDKTSDLAVLKINATGLSPATFGDVNDMEIGEQVLAIGNPGGLSFAGSLTGGMISALNRTIESHSDNGMTYIQTDAAINPGNSGGPLVNMYAQVIGINSNKIAATGYEGMGFAIPVSKAQPIINQLVRNGYVSGRCRLGITGADVESAQASLFGSPDGVIIRSIGSDSDMSRAGAQVGDIITQAGGKKVTDLDDLYSVLNAHKPGDVIVIKIYSGAVNGNGTTKTISVRLLEDKGETQK